MKIYNIFLIVIFAALSNSLSADSFLSEQSVKYVGERAARNICSAVVDDDAQDLKRKLLQYKNQLVWGYTYVLMDEAVYGNFTCNDKDLLTFANEIGAKNISDYLRGGVVSVEEYVSTVD
jgi:hypothetical protein